jgi:Ran GTPase-activating protein 1
MVAEALMHCFEASSQEGKPLGLKVFIAGRSRLENTGAKLFAQVFAVGSRFTKFKAC